MASEALVAEHRKYVAYGTDDGENREEKPLSHGDGVNQVTESKKAIGIIGSLSIAVNSLAGPAVLQLPFQYQQSGFIPTTVCLIAVGLLASLCSMHMANTVSQVPGNKHFHQCVEFSDPFSTFWNRSAYKLTQVAFFLCATCLNIAAIIDTVEMVDSSLGLHFKTYAFSVDSMSLQEWSHDPCSRKEVKKGYCNPFGDESIYGSFTLTLGYIVTASVFIPVCLMDLKENTSWQVFGFGVLLSTSVYFCMVFMDSEHLSFQNVSWWGHQWSDMLGVILFNFTLVLAIPAWLHEKAPNVSVNKVVYGSTAISTGLYIAVGCLGAMALPRVNVNMLLPMVSGAYGPGMATASSVFAFFIIGLDIPLFSVLTRYNLTHSGLCNEFTANLIVVWIPWSLSWIFYQGGVGDLLSWGGVIFTSAIAFILPLYIALRAIVNFENEGSVQAYGIPVSKQRQILLLRVTLFVACAAVAVAIGGQILAAEEKRYYLHSGEYVNSNETIPFAGSDDT